MSFKSWKSYWNFSQKVQYDFRYIRNREVDEFLNEVLISSKSREHRIVEGTILWRSQLGGSVCPIDYDNEDAGVVECPHPKERMIPRKYMASEGRVNPKGIPYLYLSTDRNTAMGEARPWIGSEISVASFKLLKDLIVIDCSLNRLKTPLFFDSEKGFFEPSEKKREESVWSHIDRAFSEPVVRSESESNYIPTQIIAELFKSNGFDGVVYKSMLGEGYNFSLFDIHVAEIMSCHLFTANKLNFEFNESANPHFYKKK